MPEQRPSRTRRRVFLIVVSLCLAVAVASVAVAALRGGDAASSGAGAPAADDTAAAPTEIPRQGALVFRTLDRNDPQNYGHIAWAPLDAPESARSVSGIGCERVHFAAGEGICLKRSGRLNTGLKVHLLGRDLRRRAEIELQGAPSRARISPDGRYATVTAFVGGHSYADVGAFSTQTTLIDVERAEVIADLEDFSVTRDGKPFDSIDFNFWGVTFTEDANRFYATLGSGGKTYLIEGDVKARSARTLRTNVECPSLSPDGRRVVYKKLMSDPGVWRYHVLDLQSGRDTALAETRPIDDQAEWLDDERVVYGSGEETWVVPADGSGPARRFLAAADSPAAVR